MPHESSGGGHGSGSSRKRSGSSSRKNRAPPPSPGTAGLAGLLDGGGGSDGTAETRPRIGNYVLGKTIGKGSYGKVKLAWKVVDGVQEPYQYAIKIIKKTKLTQEELVLISREVQIQQLLGHDNVVRVFEVLETTVRLYVVAEYCEAEVFTYLIAHKRLRENEAKRMMAGLVSAAHYLHSLGFVHRDIKLENILLAGDTLTPKLTDFGFCRAFNPNRMLATSCGSPLYAPPEILNGHQYGGPEVDVWCLGVVLFTLVAGSMPYAYTTASQLRQAYNRGERPSKSLYLSDELQDLIDSMLTVDRDARITIEGVMRHKWFRGTDFNLQPLPRMDRIDAPVDGFVVDMMCDLGFSRTRIKAALTHRPNPAATASSSGSDTATHGSNADTDGHLVRSVYALLDAKRKEVEERRELESSQDSNMQTPLSPPAGLADTPDPASPAASTGGGSSGRGSSGRGSSTSGRGSGAATGDGTTGTTPPPATATATAPAQTGSTAAATSNAVSASAGRSGSKDKGKARSGDESVSDRTASDVDFDDGDLDATARVPHISPHNLAETVTGFDSTLDVTERDASGKLMSGVGAALAAQAEAEARSGGRSDGSASRSDRSSGKSGARSGDSQSGGGGGGGGVSPSGSPPDSGRRADEKFTDESPRSASPQSGRTSPLATSGASGGEDDGGKLESSVPNALGLYEPSSPGTPGSPGTPRSATGANRRQDRVASSPNTLSPASVRKKKAKGHHHHRRRSSEFESSGGGSGSGHSPRLHGHHRRAFPPPSAAASRPHELTSPRSDASGDSADSHYSGNSALFRKWKAGAPAGAGDGDGDAAGPAEPAAGTGRKSSALSTHSHSRGQDGGADGGDHEAGRNADGSGGSDSSGTKRRRRRNRSDSVASDAAEFDGADDSAHAADHHDAAAAAVAAERRRRVSIDPIRAPEVNITTPTPKVRDDDGSTAGANHTSGKAAGGGGSTSPYIQQRQGGGGRSDPVPIPSNRVNQGHTGIGRPILSSDSSMTMDSSFSPSGSSAVSRASLSSSNASTTSHRSTPRGHNAANALAESALNTIAESPDDAGTGAGGSGTHQPPSSNRLNAHLNRSRERRRSMTDVPHSALGITGFAAALPSHGTTSTTTAAASPSGTSGRAPTTDLAASTGSVRFGSAGGYHSARLPERRYGDDDDNTTEEILSISPIAAPSVGPPPPSPAAARRLSGDHSGGDHLPAITVTGDASGGASPASGTMSARTPRRALIGDRRSGAASGGRAAGSRSASLSHRFRRGSVASVGAASTATSSSLEGSDTGPGPREVRTFLNSDTTSRKRPGEVFARVREVLRGSGATYSSREWTFSVIADEVQCEIEVCLVPHLGMTALRFAHVAGDRWRYHALCTRYLDEFDL